MKTLKFKTPLTSSEIYGILKTETEITNIYNLFPLDNNNKFFRGEVEKGNFKIIGFRQFSRNNSPAVFSGKIIETEEDTELQVSISPGNLDIIALVALLGMTILLLIILGALSIGDLANYLMLVFVVLAFDLLVFLMFFAIYKSNVKRTLRKLKELLHLEQI